MSDNLPSDVVEIDFSLEERDVRDLVRYRLFRRRGGLIRVAIGSILIVGGCVYLGPYFFPPNDRSLVPQVAGLAVGVTLYSFTLARAIEAHVKVARATKALGPRTFTVMPDGVLQNVPGVGETMRPWSAVESVSVGRNGLILPVNEYQALYVPRRVFPDERDFDRYVDLVRLRVENARGRAGDAVQG